MVAEKLGLENKYVEMKEGIEDFSRTKLNVWKVTITPWTYWKVIMRMEPLKRKKTPFAVKQRDIMEYIQLACKLIKHLI